MHLKLDTKVHPCDINVSVIEKKISESFCPVIYVNLNAESILEDSWGWTSDSTSICTCMHAQTHTLLTCMDKYTIT